MISVSRFLLVIQRLFKILNLDIRRLKRKLKTITIINYLKFLIFFLKKNSIEQYSIFQVNKTKKNLISINEYPKEPKIIGILLTWNNFEFFQYALQQALVFCDEVLLIEGCHLKGYNKRSNDGTVEYIQKMMRNPKLRVFDFDIEGRDDVIQLKIRMSLLKYSKYLEPGNWIIQWDDDRFFLEKDLKKIKAIIKNTTYDTLVFNERRFLFNFKFNTFSEYIDCSILKDFQINRIREGTCFLGAYKLYTHPRLYYENWNKYENIQYLHNVTCFHYTLVRKSERLLFRAKCSYERGYMDAMSRMKGLLKIKWKNDSEIYHFKNEIEYLIDHSGFNIYKGVQPKLLDNHVWRYVDDVR